MTADQRVSPVTPAEAGEQVDLNVLEVGLYADETVVINKKQLGVAYVSDSPRELGNLLVVRDGRESLAIEYEKKDTWVTPQDPINDSVAKIIPLSEKLSRVVIGEGHYILTPKSVITSKGFSLIVRVESPDRLERGKIGEIDARILRRFLSPL